MWGIGNWSTTWGPNASISRQLKPPYYLVYISKILEIIPISLRFRIFLVCVSCTLPSLYYWSCSTVNRQHTFSPDTQRILPKTTKYWCLFNVWIHCFINVYFYIFLCNYFALTRENRFHIYISSGPISSCRGNVNVLILFSYSRHCNYVFLVSIDLRQQGHSFGKPSPLWLGGITLLHLLWVSEVWLKPLESAKCCHLPLLGETVQQDTILVNQLPWWETTIVGTRDQNFLARHGDTSVHSGLWCHCQMGHVIFITWFLL